MKSRNIKNVIYLLLALMFSVAVSGGCGGGSSGHYSGDYSDSNQNATTESVSQDVPPISAPEPEPISDSVSGDEYGDENNDDYGVTSNDWEILNFSYFDMLNNTEWNIESITVYDDNTHTNMPIDKDSFKKGSNDIKINQIKLMTANGVMLWSDSVASSAFMEDLTVSFTDYIGELDDNLQFKHQTAPILRSSSGFVDADPLNLNKNSGTKDFTADIIETKNKTTTKVGKETVSVAKTFPTYVTIENSFSINNRSYTSNLVLKASKSAFLFESLNNTDWQVKSIQVIGSGQGRQNPITANIDNDIDKITLRTRTENYGKVLDFLVFDYKGDIINSKPLTAIFTENIRAREVSAPILRPASGFKPNGTNNGYEVFEATLETKEQAKGLYPNTEILYITQYGSKYDITFNNSFYVKFGNDAYFYWATLVLEPYKGE